MKRFLLFCLAAIALLLVGTVGLTLVLLKSGPGQQFTFRTLTPIIEERFGIRVEAGEVGGSWPEDLHARKITLSDAEGVWFYADHMDFVWHPLAWFDGHLKIDFVLLTDAEFIRAPILPAADTPSEEEETGGGGFSLPLITIADSEIENVKIGEAILGQEFALGGKVVAAKGAETARADIDLDIRSKGETDLTARLEWDQSTDLFTASLDLSEEPGGILGFLSKVEGPLILSLTGDGPASSWQGEISGEWSEFANLTGNISCNCGDFSAFRTDTDIELRPAAPASLTDQLGTDLTLSASKREEQSDDIYGIELMSARGPLTLSIITAAKGNTRTFNLSGSLTPSDTPQNEALLKLGETIRFASDIRQNKERVLVRTFNVDSENAELTLTDLIWAEGRLGGADLKASLLLDPWLTLPDGLEDNRLSVNLSADPARGEKLDIQGTVADRHGLLDLNLTGNAARALDTFVLSLQGESQAVPLDAMLAAVDVRSPLSFTADFQRDRDTSALSVSSQISWDSFGIASDDVRNLVVKINAAESVGAFTGTFSLDGEARKFDSFLPIEASSAFLSEPDGPLRVSDVIARVPGATVSGEARLEGSLPVGTLDAEIRNLKDVPFVPVDWDGSLTLKASHSNTDDIALNVQAPVLTLGAQRLEGLSVEGKGTLDRMALKAALSSFGDPAAPVVDQLDASAVLSLNKSELRLETFSAIVTDERVTLERSTSLNFAGDLPRLEPLILTTSTGGRLIAEAAPQGEALTARLRAETILIPTTAVTATGQANFNAGTEQADLDFILEPVSPEAAPQLKLDGSWNGALAKLDGALRLATDPSRREQRRTDPFFAFSLPVARGTEGNMETGELSGTIDYQGRLKDLLAFLDMDRQSADGQLTVQGTLSGPIDTPAFVVDAALKDAYYVHDIAGIDVMQTEVSARFEGTLAEATGSLSLTAHDGSSSQGAPAYQATASFERTEALPVKLDAAVVLANAALVQRDDLTAEASADLKLAGALDDLGLTGTISVENVDYSIPAPQPAQVKKLNIVRVDGPDGAPLPDDEAGGGFLSRVKLNVTTEANNRIFVRGRGLDTEWSARLKTTGTAAAPVLDGNLAVVRGFLDFGGRKFDFEKGRIRFDPNGGLDPFLDIAAANETKSDIKAGLKVSGRASAPKISLYAEPSLPEDDVMAYVLFGKPAQDLSSLEALQVARAVANLTGTGGLGGGGVLDKTRRFVGVDALSISTEGDAVGLSVGKYIRDGVYVSANQDLSGQGGSVSLEIEATKNITVETDVGQDADASVSVNWKRDY